MHARAFTATVGGAFLGLDPQTSYWVGAPAEQAVLVLGPPRSGKTSCVVIPAVCSALGPVVSTSTKPEVMAVTAALRSRFGDVWHFDPAGSEATPVRLKSRQLRLSASRSLMAT
ncbi:MAG: type IV secretory system conjugative DNA transfer family protein [Hyphomicrobiales bacterium]|nr:type IV secretory system conjugative DNA transfer family protein [Hyphomicrobiales bacterium]